MAAKRCNACLINYPAGFQECRRCGGHVHLLETAFVSDNWEERSKTLDELPTLTAEDQVNFWRLECLLHVGCPPEVADVIAASKADLHDAVRLLEAGCEPQLAQYLLT